VGLSEFEEVFSQAKLKYRGLIKYAGNLKRWDKTTGAIGLEADRTEQLRLALLLLGRDSEFVTLETLEEHWALLSAKGWTSVDAFYNGAQDEDEFDSFTESMALGDRAEYEDFKDFAAEQCRLA